jgi:hypothetical protein
VTNGVHYLKTPAETSNLRMRMQTAPATPWKRVARVEFDIVNANFNHAGICIRESSSGKIIYIGVEAFSNSVVVNNHSDPVNFVSGYAGVLYGANRGAPKWLKIEDDGTNRIYSYSYDGFNWHVALSHARTTYFVADQVGFYVQSNSSAPSAISLLSWGTADPTALEGSSSGPQGPAGPAGFGEYVGKVTAVGGETSLALPMPTGVGRNINFAAILRGAAATANDDVIIRFNGDTGANYDRSTLQNSGVSVAASNDPGSTFVYGGNIPAASAPANYFGSITGRILRYQGATYKQYEGKSTFLNGTTGLNQVMAGAWRNVAAITSITFLLNSGAAFAAGTEIAVYVERDVPTNAAFNWRGVYTGTTNYVVNDVVTYSGSSYIATQAGAGHLPTDTNYWQLLAGGGAASVVNLIKPETEILLEWAEDGTRSGFNLDLTTIANIGEFEVLRIDYLTRLGTNVRLRGRLNGDNGSQTGYEYTGSGNDTSWPVSQNAPTFSFGRFVTGYLEFRGFRDTNTLLMGSVVAHAPYDQGNNYISWLYSPYAVLNQLQIYTDNGSNLGQYSRFRVSGRRKKQYIDATTQIATGGAVYEYVAPSALATITIPVPSGYKDLEVVISGRGDGAATNPSLTVRANGDSGSNYDYTYLFGQASPGTTSETQALAQTSFFAGYLIDTAASSANFPGNARLMLDDYESTAFYKHIRAENAVRRGTGATDTFKQDTDGWWKSTVAITSLTLSLSAGNFIAGTVVRVYARGGVTVNTGAIVNNGGMVPLYDETLLAARSTISLTPPASGYRDLIIALDGRHDQNANGRVFIRFNGDSGTNYDQTLWYTSGASSIGAGETEAQTAGEFGYIASNDAPANRRGAIRCTLQDYLNTAFHKDWTHEGQRHDGVRAQRIAGGGTWKATASINAIVLSLSAGNFVAGTRVTMWGVKAS